MAIQPRTQGYWLLGEVISPGASQSGSDLIGRLNAI
jgi:hypothetical protein